MGKGGSRWGWLTVLAACNCAFWLGAAILIGLIASDSVDLGIETTIRQYQGTAVAALGQATVQTPEVTARRTSAALLQPTGATAAVRQPAATNARPAVPTPSPILLSTGTRAEPESEMTHASPVVVSTHASPMAASTGASPPAVPTQFLPTPGPRGTLVHSPLLLADPGFKDLTQMNNEMGRSAVGRPVQIRLQEAALNEAIAALVEGNDQIPYRDVLVELRRDQVAASATITTFGLPINARVVGRLQAHDCLPQVTVQSIYIAGVLIPSDVQDQIKEMLAEAMAWYPADYPLCLEQIVLEEGRATVYGSCR